MGRTSVVVVTYNHRRFVDACIGALDRAGLDPEAARLIVVDNASTDGTVDRLRALLAGDRTPGGLPALLLPQTQNLGFAGGNNLALRRAQDEGDEFAYLLNPDTETQPGFLAAALEVARAHPDAAEVQSLVLRLPGGDQINTWGNALHFLGFGYTAGDGVPLDDPRARSETAAVHDIPYASGAAVLLRLSALRRIGLLDEELFAYHEDLELSWRARLAGYRVLLAPESRVGHAHEFGRSTAKFYFMERNRFLVLARCYRAPTLALVAPALVSMEAGLWLYAARAGWWREKARAYRYFLAPGTWRALAAARRRVQALRSIGDREASAGFTGEVVFPSVAPWPLTRVANPLFASYWRLARRVMRW